jgi:hypothetical protein
MRVAVNQRAECENVKIGKCGNVEMWKCEAYLIEPHPFTKAEFDFNVPIVNQIIKYGIRIDL